MNRIERLKKVETERKILISKVKDAISDKKEDFQGNISELFKVVEFDEENVKKYEALVDAQELICDLTDQIANATSVEEIMKLRNRLNFYINKIKSELKKREIPEEELLTYQEKANELRKNIAKYLRYVKREDKLKDIYELNERDDLTKEEKRQLSKLITKENNYNRRNLSDRPVVKKARVQPKEEQLSVQEELEKNLRDLSRNGLDPIKDVDYSLDSSLLGIVEEPEDSVQEDLTDLFADLAAKKSESADSVVIKFQEVLLPDKEDMDRLYSFLDRRVTRYRDQYGIMDVEDYTGSMVSRVATFFKNLPIYSKNIKRANRMSFDYNHFYRGEDLGGYIEYVYQRNSIKNGLKMIFTSRFKDKEEECLNNHGECVNWIINYCDSMSLHMGRSIN